MRKLVMTISVNIAAQINPTDFIKSFLLVKSQIIISTTVEGRSIKAKNKLNPNPIFLVGSLLFCYLSRVTSEIYFTSANNLSIAL
ncbi:hypothetical protein, partial [Hymenobacter roseosalivarius]|uniref:hypothetical protein n=1 Tax=Hymenobacter roseosalivarius TaxID=89967 RepID=UPI001F379D15